MQKKKIAGGGGRRKERENFKFKKKRERGNGEFYFPTFIYSLSQPRQTSCKLHTVCDD
jgi:hypothetical protein